jgi:CRISPR system Cascade subunit CasD
MQSWGTQSRFTVRDTGLEPSKSGVLGLLCAALGRPRTEPVDDLAALRLGVRVDREGVVKVDYHTAGGTHRRGDKYGVALLDGGLRTVQSTRYYLADADFLVGLEGDLPLLRRLAAAVAQPVWPLFLGRKAFVPSLPVAVPDGLLEGSDLRAALATYPWSARAGGAAKRPARLRVVLEEPAGQPGLAARLDQPIGAAFLTRRFGLRHVATSFLALGDQVPIRED